ncbi:DNA damage-binding protein 2 isoform X3 [Pan paniscus]|uniref:DNA damage-binding protein 2 isoform X3 n=1 Tax=Pan paniscus TaxID=9597 RepID=UPI00001FA0EF|nr:DNA damage-binding protein 2 isoform X3 [Pan paniscus]XP_016776325.1 DNA damage-binding protein 2 isoform X3 [Pan troglodytes]
MAPKKRPETQKTSEIVLRPRNKRSRSPLELEPEAKKLCAKGSGPSRRCDSDCLWVGLAGPQILPPCRSIVRTLHQHKLGRASWPSVQQGLQQSFLHTLDSYRILQKAAPFDRRATSLAWHPTHPSTVAVGSKGGDIMLWNFGIKDKPTFIKGIGAGGSITGLKFNPLNTNQFYASSMEGTTRLQDFKGNILRVFASSDTINIWFCSLDVSASSRMVVTGDNVGNVILLNMDGKEAAWHPRYNLIVVGRYPDPNFKSCTPYELRTIDVFDGNSGKMMCQLYDPESSGISSLNEFNPMGDTLASAMGYHILIWSQEEARTRK